MNYFDKIFFKNGAGLISTAPRPVARFEKKWDRAISQSNMRLQEKIENSDPDQSDAISRPANKSTQNQISIEPNSTFATNSAASSPSSYIARHPSHNPEFKDPVDARVNMKQSSASNLDRNASSLAPENKTSSNTTDGVASSRKAPPSSNFVNEKTNKLQGLEPVQQPFQTATASPPAINISIGRLEIKAIRQEPKRQTAKAPTPPKLSLDKYIADKLNKR